ncbi:tRNA synthetases class I family protein, partial [Vibrio parahaemolyticus V-223/04]
CLVMRHVYRVLMAKIKCQKAWVMPLT